MLRLGKKLELSLRDCDAKKKQVQDLETQVLSSESAVKQLKQELAERVSDQTESRDHNTIQHLQKELCEEIHNEIYKAPLVSDSMRKMGNSLKTLPFS